MENVARKMEQAQAVTNRVELTGLLGTDPIVRKFDNGKIKADLRVAINENYKTAKGEWVLHTQWHNVTAWGTLAIELEDGSVLDFAEEVKKVVNFWKEYFQNQLKITLL